MKLWWDYKALSTYLDKNMVPRGLRLKKRPTRVFSSAFQNKWDLALLDCSKKIIGYIVEEEEMELNSLQAEIQQLQTSLEPYRDSEDYEKMNEKINEKIKTLENTIMDTKKEKFKRDLTDYKEDSVLSWTNPRNPVTPSTPRSILRSNGESRSEKNKNRNRKRRNAKRQRQVSFSEVDTSRDAISDTEETAGNLIAGIKNPGAPKDASGEWDESIRYPLRSLTPRK
ncbi:uncharacterized protein LOC130272703 [Hyla sarda]|uniref:uncharacterized protein LOC130272703 n=1 Tax=Hyla sarda TaxID=327740 RepID=UPI0024C3A51B|nr:uncharacterized protein LOC130272703 [Hyla sarda]